MTLHWWMHWFWITFLAFSQSVALPLPGETTSDNSYEEIAERLNGRQSRAMYIPRQTSDINILTPSSVNMTKNDETNQTTERPTSNVTIMKSNQTQATTEMIQVKDVDSVPTITGSKAAVLKQNTSQEVANNSLSVNDTTVNVSSAGKSVDSENAEQDFLQVDESRNLVTEKSYSHQRAEFEESPQETVARPRDPEFSLNSEEAATSGVNAGLIAGVTLASVAVFSALVAGSFALYRRHFINGPHAFNDKCSNPDSSGYLDDSTIRDNSEEMYSLDNDSFLNSLEAMTIQNYWTDTVKHTKL